MATSGGKDVLSQPVRPWGLGGSDIGALLGLSPHRSPLDVWLEKVGAGSPMGQGIVRTQNELCEGPSQRYEPAQTQQLNGGNVSREGLGGMHLRFGQHLEPFVAREYERLTGHVTHEHTASIRHPRHSHLFAHVDRLVSVAGAPVLDSSGVVCTDTLLECKTASAFSAAQWGREWSDQVPPAYLAQCIWYTTLTGCTTAHLAVLLGNSELRVYKVLHDPALGERLIGLALDFWDEHVMSAKPPTPRSRQEVERLFPKHVQGVSVCADAQTLRDLRRLRKIGSLTKRLERECDAIKDRLAVSMGEAERLTHGGKTLATWRACAPSQRLDLARLRRERPDIASAYALTSQASRRLVLATGDAHE